MKVVSQNTSLAELGMDSMMAMEVKQALEREFEIFFTAKEIRNLTFGKLKKISDANVSDDNIHDKRKLDTMKSDVIKFLVGVVKDEDFISQTGFDLSTKSRNTTTKVFLIPGIDGCGTVFNHLALNIKFSATTLHYNTNNIDTTNIIAETIDNLTNHILPKLRDREDFVIVGYSFGSIIATELARRLEAMNLKGRLILIDGAPEQIRIMYKHFTLDFNEADLQVVVLTNIMENYVAGSSQKILTELKKSETWDERYNIFAKQFLAMNTLLSPANLRTLCTTVYKNSSAVRQYNFSTLPLIKSPIMLLKSTHPLNIPAIKEDYCLHKITQNEVKVHYIEGTHVTILKNEKVPAAINGELPFAF